AQSELTWPDSCPAGNPFSEGHDNTNQETAMNSSTLLNGCRKNALASMLSAPEGKQAPTGACTRPVSIVNGTGEMLEIEAEYYTINDKGQFTGLRTTVKQQIRCGKSDAVRDGQGMPVEAYAVTIRARTITGPQRHYVTTEFRPSLAGFAFTFRRWPAARHS